MRFTLPLAVLLPVPALADVPNVVTDIAPIHSLVSQVMGDLGTPDVLVTGGASPHDFQFSFDQAGVVQDADVIIWVGEGLTPWLEDSLDTLAVDAVTLELLNTQGWASLDLRDWDDGHDHGQDDHGDHDDMAKEEGHDHSDHDDHSDHAGHDDHDSHATGGVDPHAWLDPQVAAVWADTIATTLIDQDPDNAATYRANADAAIADIMALDAEITAQLADVARQPLLVPHDAYQYFGARFDVVAVGAISLSDATTPSPAKIAELQDQMQDQNIACVLSDPQSRREWVDLVREGTDARTALADPVGSTFEVGPEHYGQTLRAMANAYASCLGG